MGEASYEVSYESVGADMSLRRCLYLVVHLSLLAGAASADGREARVRLARLADARELGRLASRHHVEHRLLDGTEHRRRHLFG